MAYPPARTEDVADVYHGVSVADPYRWLEDPDSPESRVWIEAENKVTFGYLESIPQRSAIKERITTLWNYEKYGIPSKEGGRYFYSRNDGLQNQSVLYVADALESAPRVLLDPNTLRADGTAALAGTAVTDDGRLMAYGIAEAGSDWNVWKVRDVATGQDLPDEIRWVKFGGASWTKDGKGFFYSRFDEPKEGQAFEDANKSQKIYYHRLGEPQSQDTLVYARPDQPEWYLFGGATEDGKYLIINVEPGSKVENGIFYKDLSAPDAPVVELLNKFDAKYSFVGNDGPVFWIQSDLEAPRGRVWAVNINHPEREHWKEVIPQTRNALQGAGVVGDRMFCNYLEDAKSLVTVHDLHGRKSGEVKFPGICTASGFGGKRIDTETFYAFSGYNTPTRIYRYDLKTGRSELFREAKVAFNPDEFETRQEFYRSKDGTKIPMFITSKKGLKKDGNNPTLLYGYGGFNISVTPGFSPTSIAWMEVGGVYAVANLRGGGEYGEEWHQGGMKLKKQNVFDDFISAGEYLVKEKYTSPKKLAIQGGSNGGLLVGACVNQRPDLFGAALPQVGVMDMLRFHKFTVGWGWVGDYGSSDNADEFKALYAYSPYHNVRKGVCYPATMITTADHDDRVVPAHSFKYAAALQAAQACANPILIRIDVRAGHGAGKPTGKRIEEAADVLSFLVKSLDVQTPAK
ncbi:MAG: S9 family peptidase [Phycisphaerales bacterium]|nr:S9 family peptidase [Phycisphaerales bacterium]